MTVPRVNPSAKTASRIRRNWGVATKGAIAASIVTIQPIAVDAQDRLNLNVASAGGIDTAVGALKLKLDSTPGLSVSSGGLTVLLDPTNPCLQKTSGLAVTVNAAGALTKTSSGLQVATDGVGIEINTNALRLKDAGVTLAKLGALTTKGDLLSFSTTHARLAVGTNGQVLTADSTQTTGMKWATPATGLSSPLTTKGDIWVWSTTNARLPVGTDGQVLTADSTQATGLKWSAASSGTVTSVALSEGSLFTVSGSPVTTSGTLTLTLNTATANKVFSGPASGSAATPTFRSMVAADLPGGAWLTSINSVSSLTSTHVITSASGTFEAIGLSITLPTAGTYLILLTVRALITTTVAGDAITVRLVNTTDVAEITGARFTVLAAPSAATNYQNTTTVAIVYTVAASKGVRVDAKFDGSGTTLAETPASSTSPCTLAYIQLA